MHDVYEMTLKILFCSERFKCTVSSFVFNWLFFLHEYFFRFFCKVYVLSHIPKSTMHTGITVRKWTLIEKRNISDMTSVIWINSKPDRLTIYANEVIIELGLLLTCSQTHPMRPVFWRLYLNGFYHFVIDWSICIWLLRVCAVLSDYERERH